MIKNKASKGFLLPDMPPASVSSSSSQKPNATIISNSTTIKSKSPVKDQLIYDETVASMFSDNEIEQNPVVDQMPKIVESNTERALETAVPAKSGKDILLSGTSKSKKSKKKSRISESENDQQTSRTSKNTSSKSSHSNRSKTPNQLENPESKSSEEPDELYQRRTRRSNDQQTSKTSKKPSAKSSRSKKSKSPNQSDNSESDKSMSENKEPILPVEPYQRRKGRPKTQNNKDNNNKENSSNNRQKPKKSKNPTQGLSELDQNQPLTSTQSNLNGIKLREVNPLDKRRRTVYELPVEEKENPDGLRRSKRTKIDKFSAPVYEYEEVKDFNDKIVMVQHLVGVTKKDYSSKYAQYMSGKLNILSFNLCHKFLYK